MDYDINALLNGRDLDQILAVLFSVAIVTNICYYWGLWRTFRKMGLSGWKCLIPVYSNWLMFKTVWEGSVFWFQLSIGVMVNFLPSSDIPYKYYIWIAGMAVDLIIGFVFLCKLSRAFGHGILFALGLGICPPLFYLILGLGRSEFNLFTSKKLRMSTVTLKGQEYPIHTFDNVNKLLKNDKKAAAVVELSKLTGMTYEESVEVLDKWYLYYY